MSHPRSNLAPAVVALLAGAWLAGPATAGTLVTFASPEDSVRVLEEYRVRAAADRTDVEARRAIADILGSSDRIEDRYEAAEALNEALLVDDTDADLWLRLAKVRRKQRFRAESRRAFYRALELAPDRGDVWDELARYELGRFQRFDLWSYLDDAEAANRRALALEPERVSALRREVRIAFLAGREDSVDVLLARWKKADPDDGWPWLVEGALAARVQRWDESEAAFDTGMDKVDSLTRHDFLTLRVVDPDEEEASRADPDSARHVTDYWRWADPTPADDRNPRLLEHWMRMVLAEIYFGLEERDVPGWRHAPGEMLVRYGLPEDWEYRVDVLRTQPRRINASSSWAPSTMNVRYGADGLDFRFEFMDFAMNGQYVRQLNSGDNFVRQFPSFYDLPFEEEPVGQDVEVWRFLDRSGGGRVEVAVALSSKEWKSYVLDDPTRLLTRLAIYDEHWDPVARDYLDWAFTERDPLGRLVGVWSLPGSPDSLVVGLETEDLDGDTRAASFSPLPSLEDPGDGLLLSDIAFLREVDYGTVSADSPYLRTGGSGVPNPGHRYLPGESVGIAFEAYHLGLDEAGRHQARITVSVSRPGRTGLFRVVLGSGATGASELIFQSDGTGDRFDQLLTLEVPRLEEGSYFLRVEVEDLLGGSRQGRTVPFEVIEVPGRGAR